MTYGQLEREAREAKKKPKPEPIWFAPITGTYESPISGDPRFAPIQGTYETAVYETPKKIVPPPLPPPAPPPRRIDTKGYYVSKETGRHVLTSPKLIRESHVELQKQGYMTLGGKRVRGLDIEWSPAGVPSKFAWWPERRVAARVVKGRGRQELLSWKQGLLEQYPRDKYMILWRDFGKALIYEKPTKAQLGPRYSRLEREALDAWKVIQTKFAEASKPKWTIPKFKGVSKRFGGLAEYDIPYNIRDFSAGLLGLKKETFYPAGQREREMGGAWPPAKETRWQKISLSPKEFEELYKVKPILPKDAEITYMRKTREAYEIKYETPPKTITEQFWKFMTKPRLKGYGEPESKILGGPIGGTYATQALGFPIKLGEATVGEVEEHIFGKPTVRSKIMTHEQLALSYGVIATVAVVKFGPKISKILERTRVGQAVKFSRATKAFETIKLSVKTKLPSWKGSRLDVLLAKKSKLYYEKTRGIARGEVAQKALAPKGVSLAELRWSEAYWKMIQAPRTGGVMFGKLPITTKGLQTYTFEWMLKGGALVPRFRPQRAGEVTVQRVKYWEKYWQPERGLTPFVSQTQLTRMGIYPTRKVGALSAGEITKKTLGQTLGTLATATAMKFGFPKLMKPKLEEYVPTFTREREKFKPILVEKLEEEQKRRYALVALKPKLNQLLYQPLKPRAILKPKEERKQFVVPWLQEAQILREKQVLIPKLTLKLKQEPMQRLKPITMPPMTKPPYVPYKPPLFPQFDLTGFQRKGRRGPRWGAWFFRRHPIARPEDIIALVKGRNGRAKRSAKRQRLTFTALNSKILGKPSVAPSANIFNRRMSQLKLRSNGTRRGKVRRRQSRSPLEGFNRIRSVL